VITLKRRDLSQRTKLRALSLPRKLVVQVLTFHWSRPRKLVQVLRFHWQLRQRTCRRKGTKKSPKR
jgi:hypothetical protein